MNRDLSRRRTAFSLALAMLALACMVPFAIGVFAAEGEADYVAPGYVVDFASPDAVGQCYDAYHLTAVPQDGAMRLLFDDNGGGKCDDPYLSLALPAGVDCTVFHYMAMLVRTDKHDLRGELRFRTATTGNDYPCQPFRYQATDDWQLVVVDLTDRATMIYASAGMAATGVLTNIRLDMFNNDCPSDTLYEIRAYGLYDNAADAATFVHFPDAAGAETETESGPTLDYSAIWRGEAYASPALRLRMRWLTYGFTNTAPIDSFLSAGYGGVVSNVNFTPTYLRDDREFELLAKVYDYANGLGMTTWIYDEYQWPSGKAFGQVLEGHGEYEATGVEHHRLTGNGGTAGYVCAGQAHPACRSDRCRRHAFAGGGRHRCHGRRLRRMAAGCIRSAKDVFRYGKSGGLHNPATRRSPQSGGCRPLHYADARTLPRQDGRCVPERGCILHGRAAARQPRNAEVRCLDAGTGG